MKQMNVTQIGILMDNHEEIWLDKNEVNQLRLDVKNETLMLCNGDYISAKIIDSFEMKLSANANHTYNSFGYPSSETIFRRLIGHGDASGVMYRTHNEEVVYCIPDNYCLSCNLDELGNLYIHMEPEEAVYGCCEYCDCCE